MKSHIIYNSIIAILLAVLFITNIPNIFRFYFDRDGSNFLIVEEDFNIVHPETKSLIGILYKGAILQSPNIEDIHGDLGDNDTWKIIIEADAINGSRKYVKESDRVTHQIPFFYELSK